MKSLNLAAIAEITQGRILNPEVTDVVINRIATDSRIDLSGALFVALRGARFDAHDFIEAAERNGAIALLVEREIESSLPQVIVNDTQLALGY
ncbi:MAG: UDP-N-acetylmuramoylalanyl-D-glutamyl-2, 6-diaminopimelate--D-alanyl-D-alanine ligase, partial [Enterobacterales bacterium]|nr:UDP-N-acetylmuramoylalanyl-D-glutamyl-2, 6-diaminopimelate--D-alanyl-D-alanine ligase [Enterobacterales bacterium]